MKQDLLSVAILGYTGAVGGEVLKTLLKESNIKKIVLLGRRKIEVDSTQDISSYIIDVCDPQSYENILTHIDSAICTLGVGEPSKVSKDELVRVDKQAALHFANACKKIGVKHFQLLGSVCSSSSSLSFYLRTKGELVKELEKLNFERLSIFQPSMIITPTNRYGLSQWITLKAWPGLSHMMFGKLSKFKGIKVEALGQAIAKNVLTQGQAREVLHVDDILKLKGSTLRRDGSPS